MTALFGVLLLISLLAHWVCYANCRAKIHRLRLPPYRDAKGRFRRRVLR